MDKRAIVGVSDWDTCDVGTNEGASLSEGPSARGHRVSSMRSSLFQKAKKKSSVANESAKLFANEDDAASMRLPFQFVGSEPEKMCSFGRANKKNWTKDMFAIAHNAVRCELGLVVEVLESIKQMGERLTIGDIAQFHDWWETASAVVLDFLDVETKVFIPWIADAVASSETTDECSKVAAAIPVTHSALRDLVEKISNLFNRCLSDSPMAVSAAGRGKDNICVDLIITFDRFITRILKHMYEQEVALPSVLSAYYKNEKVDRERMMESIITETAKGGRQPDLMLVLHTRWMTDAKGMKAYLRKIKDCYDCSMSRLQSQFELMHAGTVAVFKVKATK